MGFSIGWPQLLRAPYSLQGQSRKKKSDRRAELTTDQQITTVGAFNSLRDDISCVNDEDPEGRLPELVNYEI